MEGELRGSRKDGREGGNEGGQGRRKREGMRRAEMCLKLLGNLLPKLPSVNKSRRAELESCTLGKHCAAC